MMTWIWIAIIVLVIYMMFRRQGAQKSSGTVEPQEAPREEKVISPEEITQAEAEHTEVTAEHTEPEKEESDETKAA